MRKHKDTLAALKSVKNLLAECPMCQKEFPLRQALLFYADEPIPEKVVQIRADWEDELHQRGQDLRTRRKRASEGAEKKSIDVKRGFGFQQIAPLIEGFGFNPRDCRSLGNPIDYLIFDGLTDGGTPDRISFVDIKVGQGDLNAHQRSIRDAVEAGNVRMEAVSWPRRY